MLEIGELTIDHNWTRVVFRESFSAPIVVAKPLSHNEDDPAVVRIRNVDTTGFEIRLQEWDYLDGMHVPETVGYRPSGNKSEFRAGIHEETGVSQHIF